MNSLEEYGALFEKLGLSELEIQEGEFRLKLKKEISSCVQATKAGVITESSEKRASDDNVKEAVPDPDEIIGEAIKSPLLGIFYSAGGGNKAVKEGDCVKEGDILCTIEAMKMMNEVKSTKSGVIKKICAKDGDLVEYNQELFIVA